MKTRTVSTVLRRHVPHGALLIAALVALACSDDAFTTRPNPNETAASFGKGGPKGGGQSKILFGSNRDGGGAANEVYSMNDDGSSQTRLTFVRVNDGEAVYSPDGTKIAFYSVRDNALGEIYVMNADGSNVVRLTNTPGASQRPSWSPDGKKIAFQSTRDAADPTLMVLASWEIYTMNANGSNVKRITNNAIGDLAPQWSPDGLHIAFNSDRDHVGQGATRDIYLMNIDGSNVTRLTNQDGQIADESWDPSGTHLTYSVIPAATNPGIYVLDVTTLVATRLTFGPGIADAWPSFSPDGKKIAYAHYVNGLADIWVMNADGTNPTQITFNAYNDSWPKWSR